VEKGKNHLAMSGVKPQLLGGPFRTVVTVYTELHCLGPQYDPVENFDSTRL
jgi:hypothetical protein